MNIPPNTIDIRISHELWFAIITAHLSLEETGRVWFAPAGVTRGDKSVTFKMEERCTK